MTSALFICPLTSALFICPFHLPIIVGADPVTADLELASHIVEISRWLCPSQKACS